MLFRSFEMRILTPSQITLYDGPHPLVKRILDHASPEEIDRILDRLRVSESDVQPGNEITFDLFYVPLCWVLLSFIIFTFLFQLSWLPIAGRFLIA